MGRTVQIRNVDEATVAELKSRAAAARMSLSDYLAKELDELASRPTLDDVLHRLSQRPVRALPVSSVELVREARAEREEP